MFAVLHFLSPVPAHPHHLSTPTVPPCPPGPTSQLRQHVYHKRTFFFLEQLILKHGADVNCINIKSIHEGEAVGEREGRARVGRGQRGGCQGKAGEAWLGQHEMRMGVSGKGRRTLQVAGLKQGAMLTGCTFASVACPCLVYGYAQH